MSKNRKDMVEQTQDIQDGIEFHRLAKPMREVREVLRVEGFNDRDIEEFSSYD